MSILDISSQCETTDLGNRLLHFGAGRGIRTLAISDFF